MSAPSTIDPSRLYQYLANTGLQQKDNPLYQTIYYLIGNVLQLKQNQSSGGSGGGSSTIINNISSPIPGPAGEDGSDGDIGPPGTIGINGLPGSQGPIGPMGAILALLDDLPEPELFPPIVGPQGNPGTTGAQGPVGIPILVEDGADGEDGVPGPPGSSGNANITYGTWTPVIGGSGGTSGQTYSGQVGLYAKIALSTGSLVIIAFRAALTNKGTITTNVQVEGLPFTATTANISFPVAISWANLNTAMVFLQGLIINNTSVISVRAITAANVTVGTITTSAIANLTALSGIGFYFTD